MKPAPARAPASLPLIAGALVGLAALVLLGWLAVHSRIATGEPVATDRIDLLLNDFSPDAAVVPAGTIVTWRFDGDTVHDIVGDGWGTAERRNGTFMHTFTQPGTYDYRCTLHGPMRGRVVVE